MRWRGHGGGEGAFAMAAFRGTFHGRLYSIDGRDQPASCRRVLSSLINGRRAALRDTDDAEEQKTRNAPPGPSTAESEQVGRSSLRRRLNGPSRNCGCSELLAYCPPSEAEFGRLSASESEIVRLRDKFGRRAVNVNIRVNSMA